MNDDELAEMLTEAEAGTLFRRRPPLVGTMHESDLTRRLILACEYGHPDLVRVLVQAGANVHQLDSRGNSPLVTACRYGHAAIAALLLQIGVGVDQPNASGLAALHVASETCATAVEYDPARHKAQACEPLTSLNDPAAHGLHGPPSGPVYPAVQMQSVTVELPATATA